MLDSSVHGAPVSFMQDGTLSVQLSSSSDAERIVSVMIDIGRTTFPMAALGVRAFDFDHRPFALHLPVPRFLFAILLCLDHTAGTNCSTNC